MAAAKLECTVKSWDKVKGDEIKGAKLSSAIKDAEKAKGAVKKDDADSLSAYVEAMENVDAAAQETMKKECDAKKQKDIVASIKKFCADTKTEIKKLQEAAKKAGASADDDGEESDEELLCPNARKICLKKAKTKGNALDGVSFAFGVAKKPEDCKLVMMKKKNFSMQLWRRFMKMCKENDQLKGAGLKKSKLTYGAAYRDPEDSTTLVLQLHLKAKSDIPAMDMKAVKWMRRNKQEMAPFKKLLLLDAAGKPLVSPPEPEGEADEAAESPEVAETEAKTGQGAAGAAATEAPAEAQAAAENQAPAENKVAAEAAHEEIHAAAADGATDAAAFDDKRKEFRKMRRAWQSVKEQAIQDLEAVKDGIRDYYLDDPEQFKIATSKLNQLDAIMDNLNDDLRDTLDKYVSTPRSRQGELDRLGNEATEIVQKFVSFANSDKLLNAVDQKEFADVTVKAPIEKALKDLVKTLA